MSKKQLFMAAIFTAVAGASFSLFGLVGAANANAAEIKLLSGRGFSPVLDALGGEFERTTGHKVTISYGPGHKISERIRDGEMVDMAILPSPLINELVKQGKIVGGSTVNIAHSDVGMGIRAGTQKPDTSSLDAFKRSLLAANVIVLSDPKIGATTNAYFTRMLERLGIADQMKAKVKFVSDAHTADYVAKGEADIAVQLGNELLAVPGIEFVPLPPEFQTKDFIFSAGVSTGAKEPEASKALIQFLAAPAAIPVIKAKHLDPG
jgi:molybdate transport system substrate-binding protein